MLALIFRALMSWALSAVLSIINKTSCCLYILKWPPNNNYTLHRALPLQELEASTKCSSHLRQQPLISSFSLFFFSFDTLVCCSTLSIGNYKLDKQQSAMEALKHYHSKQIMTWNQSWLQQHRSHAPQHGQQLCNRLCSSDVSHECCNEGMCKTSLTGTDCISTIISLNKYYKILEAGNEACPTL